MRMWSWRGGEVREKGRIGEKGGIGEEEESADGRLTWLTNWSIFS